MAEDKAIRLSKAAKELNVGLTHVVEFLESKGIAIESNPNTRITPEVYAILQDNYMPDRLAKLDAQEITREKLKRDNVVIEATTSKPEAKKEAESDNDDSLKKSLDEIKLAAAAEKKTAKKKEEPKPEPEVIKAKADVDAPKILGKIDLDAGKKKSKKKEEPVVEKPTKKPVKVEAKEQPIIEDKKVEEKSIPNEKPEPAKVEAAIPEVTEVVPTPVAPVETDPVVETPAKAPTKEDTANLPPEHISVRVEKLSGPNILGKIVLPVDPPKKKPVASSSDFASGQRKRKRKENPSGSAPQGGGAPGTNQQRPWQQGQQRPGGDNRPGGGNRPFNKGANKGRPAPAAQQPKVEPTDKEIQDQIKATLARLSGSGKSKASKFRKEKRDLHAKRQEALDDTTDKVIKVTEFVSANELAKMLNVQVNQIIATCMSLGLFVSINQRLDAETITVVAGEFGYTVEFVSADVQEAINDDIDDEADLETRAPIVTVMGHVDHGKTSLLDYIRKANVIAGEAGGITQHIGAYEVTLENGRKITFLDTPGHEAFTAMRARGAKVTDVAIIVVSADDSVMPQTKEAINHAQAAGVPIVFAINKIDKPDANPERIKEQLASMNYLVEDWGGKYQSQDISAKKGLNVDKLLEKVLLESDLLDLKANPDRLAKGTVIESSLDKGRGYVTTVLVQTGTLKIGDIVLAGCYSGRVKAMFNERGGKANEAGPSHPALILGMSGAPQAGDQFNVMDDEREAREIANKRLQLQREQGIRTHKHITLDEIGRRLAIGNFKELNVIVKGDVDGSVEALADSLLKLSNPEIQVNVIMKGVGQISESDVNLASASNAIIIGFQVRPSVSARKLAENEEIDIRLYSIIYDAINEVKAAMEGMLAPEFEEKITCNVQVRETFKIPKVGTIAGCMVLEGKINRNTQIRVIRDGIVVHSGELASLKRFKDDAKEVQAGMECGLNINKFNDIKEGDIIEGYEQVAIKRTLA
jgi:translation initiation factor IF-2